MEKNTRLTISDIARKAGVSKTTVSRVLNNRPDVDEETRFKIRNIIEELNYSPSYTAKSLSTGKRNLIGLIVPSLSSYFSLAIIRGVAEGIADTQYELVLYTTGLSEYNQQIYTRAIRNDLVDGIILVLPRDHKENYLMAKHEIPMVVVDYSGIDVIYPSITVTNEKGAYEATNYLIDLGHKKIGFITGLMDLGCSKDRYQGFKRAMAEKGLTIDQDFVGAGNFTRVSGELIGMDWLQQKDRPSAIFASNDDMVFGVMEAAEKLGLSIPSQLSIIGFDDVIEAKLRSPALTTVRQPLFKMGMRAAEGIIKLIAREDFQSIELDTELIVRHSCAPPSLFDD